MTLLLEDEREIKMNKKSWKGILLSLLILTIIWVLGPWRIPQGIAMVSAKTILALTDKNFDFQRYQCKAYFEEGQTQWDVLCALNGTKDFGRMTFHDETYCLGILIQVNSKSGIVVGGPGACR